MDQRFRCVSFQHWHQPPYRIRGSLLTAKIDFHTTALHVTDNTRPRQHQSETRSVKLLNCEIACQLMPSRRSRLSSKEEGADSAESGHDSRQHAAFVQRAFTADVSALAPRNAAEGDQGHFAASQNDGENHRSLVSLMLSSLSQSAPGSRQVRRSFSLPVELKRSSVTGADESTLVTYKGVSRSLWNTRYDAHVSTHVSDGPVKNVFLGSFDNSHSAARAYDLGRISLGCRDDEELNFPVTHYTDDLQMLEELSIEEIAEMLVEASQNTERRTSRFRGVVAREGGFEARLELGW